MKKETYYLFLSYQHFAQYPSLAGVKYVIAATAVTVSSEDKTAIAGGKLHNVILCFKLNYWSSFNHCAHTLSYQCVGMGVVWLSTSLVPVLLFVSSGSLCYPLAVCNTKVANRQVCRGCCHRQFLLFGKILQDLEEL